MLTSGGGSAPELELELLRVGYRFWKIDDELRPLSDRNPVTSALGKHRRIVRPPPPGWGKIGSKTIMDRA